MEDKFAGLKEKIDILDEDGNKIGETKTYDEVHEKGLLHLTVHVWLVNSKGQILLQKRSKYVRAYPEYFDIPAGGHVISSQNSLQGAQLETKEELGLELPESAFNFLFRVKEFYITNEGTHTENALNDVYLVNFDFNVEDFKTEHNEVTEVRFLDLEEFQKWISGAGEPLAPHEEEYKKILEYLK